MTVDRLGVPEMASEAAVSAYEPGRTLLQKKPPPFDFSKKNKTIFRPQECAFRVAGMFLVTINIKKEVNRQLIDQLKVILQVSPQRNMTKTCVFHH